MHGTRLGCDSQYIEYAPSLILHNSYLQERMPVGLVLMPSSLMMWERPGSDLILQTILALESASWQPWDKWTIHCWS